MTRERSVDVPVWWIVAQEALGLKLVEGRDDVGVRWAHAIEQEDPTPWLVGGEMVLTTGLRVRRSAAEQTAYVERLASVGVAALGFGTGFRYASVPTPVRDACRRTGITLVEVPYATPFLAIAQAVASRLAEEQRAGWVRAVRFQRRLTKAALDDGVRGTVRALAEELDGTAAVVDERGEALGVFPADRGDLVERVRAAVVPSDGTHRPRTSYSIVDATVSVEIQLLGTPTRPTGWLAIEVTQPLTSPKRLLVDQAAGSLSLQREQPRAVATARHDIAAVLMGLLEARPENAVLALVERFGFRPADAVRPLVVADADDPVAVLDALDDEGVAVLGVVDDAEVRLVVREADVKQAVKTLEAVTEHAVPPAVVAVGRTTTLDALGDGFAPARRLLGASGFGDRVRWPDDRLIGAVLDDGRIRTDLRRVAEQALGPLGAGSARAAVLRESLEVYLRHHGAWESAAAALDVHRHTLRNRMTRVEELTGLDLDDPEIRALLLLALIAER